MASNEDKLLLEELLLEGPSGTTAGAPQQLSSQQRLLLTGAKGPSEESEPSGPELRVYDPVDFYLLLDASKSEDTIIQTVLSSVQDFAAELYGSADTGSVRFLLSLVRDHDDGSAWYQEFKATGDMDTFAKQLRNVRCFGGGDEPEALECAWYKLAERVLRERQLHPGRKAVAVTVSSSVPHDYFNRTWTKSEGEVWGVEYGDRSQGQRRPEVRRGSVPRSVRVNRDPLKDPRYKFHTDLPDGSFSLTDDGCVHQTDYAATWKALTAAVEGNYFVGTSRLPYSPFNGIPMHDWQRECVMTGDSKQHYLAINNLSDLSATFMAAVRATQSPEALDRLLGSRYQGQLNLERQLRQLTAPGKK
jgi:hypothetical protein